MDISKIKSNLVVTSNDLVHAKYDLSLWQKRLFIYTISQLNKDEKDFSPIRMNISDVIRFFKGSDSITTYRAIIEAPKSLDRTIEVPYMTEKGGLRYGYIRLLQKYTIPIDDKDHNQYIEISFNNDLKPHLLDLKEKFLKYDIRNIIELQSTYSFRFYEILKSYEFRNQIELELGYLRTILEVTNIYKSYKDFKRRIIEKAREDLTKFCDITFSYEEKKGLKGKKIETILFYIHKNTPSHRAATENTPNLSTEDKSVELALIDDKNINIEITKIIKKDKITEVIEVFPSAENVQEKLIVELSPLVVTQFGVSLKVFMGLVELYTEGVIRQAIELTHKTIKAGKVENTAGFFVEAVRGNYTDPQAQKQEQAAAQKAKLVEIKKTEQAVEQQKKDQKQVLYEQEVKIFTQLLQNEASLIPILIDKVQTTMFRSYYKADTSFEENLKQPLLKAAFLNAAKEVRPFLFGL